MPEYDLTIEVRPHPAGATVVVLAGELDHHTAPRLHRMLEQVPAALPVVLDLAGLGFCDSVGVAALLHALRRTEQAGTALVLVAVAPDLGHLLALTGVDRVLPRRATVAEAVEALRPPA
ncbi:STAS domain-containing protein [Kitasatospora sp. NPDC088134]|uniref:STAS domain-containing protein n=1 Tax=Kitasatospora sp. NPDC088134 TaxID=3364071 RepID=UPI0037FCD8AC